jgi:hypothetical protein
VTPERDELAVWPLAGIADDRLAGRTRNGKRFCNDRFDRLDHDTEGSSRLAWRDLPSSKGSPRVLLVTISCENRKHR